MKKYISIVTLGIIGILLSFTDFYSVGYILIILSPTIVLNDFFIFKSILQRFILFLLAFLATIPLVGLICWIVHIDILPIYNIIGFILIMSLLFSNRKQLVRTASSPIIDKADKADIVAGLVALVPVVIILVSFLPSQNHSAALFQLASEGWDNGSHILMIEDVSSHHGYVYGSYDKLKNEIITPSNAYPQAWHLTTADFMNGFGGNRFDPHKPIETIATYMIASIGWMVLASYLFVLCAWRLYEHLKKKKVQTISEITPLIGVSFVIQIIVMYGSLASGFTNYIGSVVYLLLLAAMTIEILRKPTRKVYILAILFGTMSVLTWFLTFPPIALTILVILLLRSATLKESIVNSLKDWRLLSFLVFGFAAMVLQIYIFHKFSVVGGSNQLDAGVRINAFSVVNGVFPINQIFFAIVVGIGFIYCYQKQRVMETQKLLLTIILPWLILVFGLFLYQNITVNYTSYYLSKVLGLSIIGAGIVASAVFTLWVNEHIKSKSHKNIIIPIVSILLVGLIVIGTGQSTYGLNKLFQRNERTSYNVAVKTTAFLKNKDFKKSYIVTLTNDKASDGVYEGNHGKLEMNVTHQHYNCAFRVTRDIPLSEELVRLSTCADTLKKINKSITVVTSPKTVKQVRALRKSNIIIENAK